MEGDDAKYDNTAFRFFLLTVLLLFIGLSGLYSVIRVYLTLFKKKVKVEQGRTEAEIKRLKKLDAKQRSLSTLFTTCFTVNVILLVVAIISTIVILQGVQDIEQEDIFDPFEILQLPTSATRKEIKSAYRKLSLLYHPDKNQDDPEAADMFVRVSKAHLALTDDVARENYEKYGNPDGKQATKGSIGLPSWLLERENTNVVIFGYLAGLAVIFSLVCWCNRGGASKGAKLTPQSQMAFARALLKGEKPSQYIHDVFLLAHEFRKVAGRPANQPTIEELADILKKEHGLVTDNVKAAAINDKELEDSTEAYCHNRTILLGYLHRLGAGADLEELLKLVDPAMDSMIQLLHTSAVRDKNFVVAPAEVRLAVAERVVQFKQRLVQAIYDVERDSIYQLPHLDCEEFIQSRRKRKKMLTLKSFMAFDEDKQARILEVLTPEQRADVMSVADALPVSQCTVTTALEKKVMAEFTTRRDIITLRATVERNYGDDELEEAPIVHAPYYPFEKREEWWCLMSITPVQPASLVRGRRKKQSSKKKKAAEVQTGLMMARMKEDGLTMTMEQKFPAPPPGTYTVTAKAMCDSYAGVDVEATWTFTTIENTMPEPVSSGGHGHSHGGQECHGHGEPELKDDVDFEESDGDDDDAVDDGGGILAALRAKTAAPEGGAGGDAEGDDTPVVVDGVKLTARQVRQRRRRQEAKRRRQGFQPEDEQPQYQAADASESEDDDWGKMLDLANE